ncbi:MAG: metal ABC transporter substrate-binding protein, partial [Dehalococcoidia bacterium]
MGLSKIIILSVLAGPLLALAACGGSPSPTFIPTADTASPTPSDKLKVATTNAILADFIRNVGGSEVEVESIVPLGADLHTFQSTPRISVTLSEAKVIISNGLGLDASLDSVINSAIQSDAIHVAASDY